MTQAAKAGRPPVLVIEDEPSVIAFIQAALERSGYHVKPVASGAEALELLRDGGDDYLGIISDMRTPGGVTGADVYAWITSHRHDLLGRVVFITGDTVNEETLQLLQSTGAPCIEKPFRVQQLIAAVEETFGRSA
ncbi:MAG TPA: response regulator [Terriglobales bacterium]|nr:response regulator [Terriglobales bacterium]